MSNYLSYPKSFNYSIWEPETPELGHLDPGGFNPRMNRAKLSVDAGDREALMRCLVVARSSGWVITPSALDVENIYIYMYIHICICSIKESMQFRHAVLTVGCIALAHVSKILMCLFFFLTYVYQGSGRQGLIIGKSGLGTSASVPQFPRSSLTRSNGVIFARAKKPGKKQNDNDRF